MDARTRLPSPHPHPEPTHLKDCSGWLASEFSREPDEDGLVTDNVKLSVESLRVGNANGLVAWSTDEDGYAYWRNPAERGVILFDKLKIPERDWEYIRSALNKNTYEITWDTAFHEVIKKCASVRRRDWVDPSTGKELENGAWITDPMQKVYCQAARQGIVHSIEARRDGKLAGGIYGVQTNGGPFSAESMFRADGEDNVGKVLFYLLIKRLQDSGHWFMDVQEVKADVRLPYFANSLSAKWGGVRVSREQYLEMLRAAQAKNLPF